MENGINSFSTRRLEATTWASSNYTTENDIDVVLSP